jgi:AraC-like DNA-binding protein
MHTQYTVPVIYCRMIIGVASRSKADIGRLLAGTGLAPDDLHKLDTEISLAGFARLLRNAREVSGDGAIVIEAGAKIPMTAHGPVGYAYMFSPNLKTSFEVMGKFGTQRIAFATVDFVARGEKIEVRLDVDDALGEEKPQLIDFMMVEFMNSLLFRDLIPLSPIEISLRRSRPDYHRRYRTLLNCPIRYEQPYNSFQLSRTDLELPLPGSDPEQFAAALQKCQALYSGSRKPTSLRDTIENIFALHPGQLWTIGAVADELGLSVSTLQRRLVKEGVGFRKIQESWLKTMAVHAIARENSSVAVTAMLLGYFDEASFRRAFKRWFNCTPRDYLQRHSVGGPMAVK